MVAACKGAPVRPGAIDEIEKGQVGNPESYAVSKIGRIRNKENIRPQTYTGIIVKGIVNGMPTRHQVNRFLCRASLSLASRSSRSSTLDG